MPDRILVTYSSRTGSTAGVALAIGKTLSDLGMQVDVRRMQEVTFLTPYQAVIAGSAIRNKIWLPEAIQFMTANQGELTGKPFAAFLVCMTLTMKDDYQDEVHTWLQPVRLLVKPLSEGFFPGALDIPRIESFADRLKFRISVAMGVWTEGDHRDWDAIKKWTERLPAPFTGGRN